MADRIDPLGSWFNLGDRKIDELPSVEESRALMPRSAESHAMSPVGVQTLHRRLPSSIFTAGANTYSWQTAVPLTSTPTSYYLRVNVATPNAVYFHATLDTLEQGAIFSGISLRSYRLSTQSIVAQLLQIDQDGTPTILASITSTAAAANKTDSSNGMLVPGSSANIIDLTNYTYIVQLRMGQGTNPDDFKVFWVDLQYTVPG